MITTIIYKIKHQLVVRFGEIVEAPKAGARIDDEIQQGPTGRAQNFFPREIARIALVDGRLTPPERQFLERVATIFGLVGRVFSEQAGQPAAAPDAYAVLGVARNAATADIKAAWRRLTREHHPDTLMAKGVPPEYVDMATKKMASINAAWDRICRERGES